MGKNRREAEKLFDALEVEIGSMLKAENGMAISKKARLGVIKQAKAKNMPIADFIQKHVRPAMIESVPALNESFDLQQIAEGINDNDITMH